MVASFGAGAVVSCDPSRLLRARESLAQAIDVFGEPAMSVMEAELERDGQTLVGPHLKFFCSRERLQRPQAAMRCTRWGST